MKSDFREVIEKIFYGFALMLGAVLIVSVAYWVFYYLSSQKLSLVELLAIGSASLLATIYMIVNYAMVFEIYLEEYYNIY